MPILDYQPVERTRPKRGFRAFFTAFAVAYLPGLVLVSFMDGTIHNMVFRHGGDGGVVIVGGYVFPIFALLAAAVWRVHRSGPVVAAVIGFLGPSIGYLAWVLLS